jgi:hypothetical protein
MVFEMVHMEEDTRSWNVTITIEKEKCPYRYYPSNIVGCTFDGMEEKECTLENCPLIS